MPSCSLIGCKNSSPNVSLHQLPTNHTKRKKWLEIIGVENLKGHVKKNFLCSVHFDEESFNRTLNVTTLRDDALPSHTLLSAFIKARDNTKQPTESKNNRPDGLKVPSCAFLQCKNNTINTYRAAGITFHSFPKDIEYKKTWIKVVRLSRCDNRWKWDKSARICSKHFQKYEFYETKKGIYKLNKTAVPTIQLQNNIETDDDEEKKLYHTKSAFSTSNRISGKQRYSNAELHVNIRCSNCEGEIRGFRYICIECTDWDMCGSCEARGAHRQHYVLRLPGPRPQSVVVSLIESIQKQFEALENEMMYLESEIKAEYLDDPLDEEEDPYVVPDIETEEPEEEYLTEYLQDEPSLPETPLDSEPESSSVPKQYLIISPPANIDGKCTIESVIEEDSTNKKPIKRTFEVLEGDTLTVNPKNCTVEVLKDTKKHVAKKKTTDRNFKTKKVKVYREISVKT